MDEKEAKKLYNKMSKDNMLPELFSGDWTKDRVKFLKQMELNSRIGVDFQEYEGDDDEDDY